MHTFAINSSLEVNLVTCPVSGHHERIAELKCNYLDNRRKHQKQYMPTQNGVRESVQP